MKRFAQTCCAALATALLVVSPVSAQKAKKSSKPQTIASGLDNPSGVVVNKGGVIYIASHAGVLAYKPGKGAKTVTAIGSYPNPTDIYGKGPKYNIGPLGVALLDDGRLVVGDGSRADGDELVRVYKVGDGVPTSAQKEADAVQTLGPIKASELSAKGEGNFYGVAIGAGAIFVTCNGDDTQGWVSKAEIKDGKIGELKPTIATKKATEVDAPVAITFSPKGDLVVGQMGEMAVPGDSLLTFYDAKTGKLKAKYETGLNDIAGLAYSPKTGKLYAVDFSWSDTTKGGVFELTIDGKAVKTNKIASLDKPAAIAFDSKGDCYVVQFGTAKEGDKKSPGSLVRIKGL
ncbi:MAG: hypothetical protein O3A00_20595 [Planctomycetota bacterium]|nr:hypothetical protein [Planctomycetota bacterium]